MIFPRVVYKGSKACPKRVHNAEELQKAFQDGYRSHDEIVGGKPEVSEVKENPIETEPVVKRRRRRKNYGDSVEYNN